MLTAYQCEVVAFVTDGGIICRDCAIARLDRGELDSEVSPLIRYSLDEEQSVMSEDWVNWDYDAEEIRDTEDGRFALIHGRWHAEGCACGPAIFCDDGGEELVEEYVDYTCRSDDEPVPNPAVPRWVPCSRCGAGDGQPHREGCGYL